MHSDGGDFTGNRKKKEVISALCILGCMWYLRWRTTCLELTLFVPTVRNRSLLSLIPESISAGPRATHSNSEMFPAASTPLDSVENSSKTHTNTLLTEIACVTKSTVPVCRYTLIGRHSLEPLFLDNICFRRYESLGKRNALKSLSVLPKAALRGRQELLDVCLWCWGWKWRRLNLTLHIYHSYAIYWRQIKVRWAPQNAQAACKLCLDWQPSSFQFAIYDLRRCVHRREWRSRKLTPTRKSKKNKNQDIDSSKNTHWSLSGLFEIINII